MLSLNDCSLCRLQLSDMLLDNSTDGVIDSVYRFCKAFDHVAEKYAVSHEEAVTLVITDLHKEHSA